MRFKIGADQLSVVGGVILLVLIVGIVAHYCVSLELRVYALETQIKVLTSQPDFTKPIRSNPLVETCQQLYAESVESARRVGDFGATARSHISSLNCDEVVKSAGKRL
jgi:hypothetical protein